MEIMSPNEQQMENFVEKFKNYPGLKSRLEIVKYQVQVFALPEDKNIAELFANTLNNLAGLRIFNVVDVSGDVLLPGQNAKFEGEQHAHIPGLSIVIMPNRYDDSGKINENYQMHQFFNGEKRSRTREMTYVTLSPSSHREGFKGGVLEETRYNIDNFEDVDKAMDRIVSGLDAVS